MDHAGEISILSELAEPDVAAITIIGEAHIENLGSREKSQTRRWKLQQV